MMSVTRSCWQSNTHKDRVLESLNLQRRSGCLCDVVLVAGDNPPQRFHAHRAVLAACSDYFRAMFNLSMMESGAQEVTLKGVGDLGLEKILDFAYTGQVVLESCGVREVLAAASHFQFLEIQCFCSKFLAQEITLSNINEMHSLADLYGLSTLKEALIDFLVAQLPVLLANCPTELLSLPSPVLTDLLQNDKLTALSEHDIWKRDPLSSVLFISVLDEVLRGLPEVVGVCLCGETILVLAFADDLLCARTPSGIIESLNVAHACLEAVELKISVEKSSTACSKCHQQALHVIGGKYRDNSKSNQVRYLSTKAGTWKGRTTLPKVCSHHCIAVLGMFLYVAGGQEKKWANRSVYRFDPRGDGCWLEVAPMLKCREHFALGALNGRLFAAGGRNELRQLLPTVEAYCPLTNKWTLVAPLEHSLSCHAGCVADGLFWVSGGVTNTAQYQGNLTAYDPTEDCWTQYSGMPHRRVYHTMASIPGRLYVLGGNSLDGNNDRVIVPDIDRYCIASNQWSRLRMRLPAGRNEGAVAVHKDRIYLLGGYSIVDETSPPTGQVLDASGMEGDEQLIEEIALPFAAKGLRACFLPEPPGPTSPLRLPLSSLKTQ
uniref:kelch-like protein 32 n=1 Tax=Myxine glutinosa TaxID=7769 RepID=UPI00358FC1B5